MIRVLVLYQYGPGKRFDHQYYLQRHIPMVEERLRPHGLISVEVDAGLRGMKPGDPPIALTACMLLFGSLAEFEAGMAVEGTAILSDIPNYTNMEVQFQINEVRYQSGIRERAALA